MCQPGYRGDYCEIAPACAGILDAAGNCCPAGVVSASGACCTPVRSENGLDLGSGFCILDAAGNCCAAGVVSASGACCPPVRPNKV